MLDSRRMRVLAVDTSTLAGGVALVDGDRPHVKVIDFGVAKALTERLTDGTLHTTTGQLVGTPEYMSPEQAEGSLDVDTRTDVGAAVDDTLGAPGVTTFGVRSLTSIRDVILAARAP